MAPRHPQVPGEGQRQDRGKIMFKQARVFGIIRYISNFVTCSIARVNPLEFEIDSYLCILLNLFALQLM